MANAAQYKQNNERLGIEALAEDNPFSTAEPNPSAGS